MNDTKKKMTSIARRINTGFWFGKLWTFIWFDIVVLAGIFASYMIWCEKVVPGPFDVNKTHSFFIASKHITRWKYVIEGSDGQLYKFFFAKNIDVMLPGIIALGILQVLDLFFSLFKTVDIRRKMKPLNDLAIKAEQISSIPLDESHLYNLEQAIAHLSPDEADSGVHTGDHELQSIETALNNLLYKMKQTQYQQARFVSDASHELRTPISVIQGYVNMLDRWGKEDEEVLEESITALKNESQHMKELIEQLLFLARGDSGRNTLKKTEVVLNDLVKDVCEESEMIDPNHKYVVVEKNSGVCMNGDISMIKQSMRIFIQNAAKYSNAGDTITLGVRSEMGSAIYTIQDEGVGMAEADVAHIFERFYRSDSARNSETGGSGLGLSIAKWIIDAHDGTIEVLSRPEFGTRFTIKFPVENKM